MSIAIVTNGYGVGLNNSHAITMGYGIYTSPQILKPPLYATVSVIRAIAEYYVNRTVVDYD